MRYRSLFVASALLSAVPAPADDLPRKVKPVVVLTGVDSKQAGELFARCGSQEEWEAGWRAHRGREKAATPAASDRGGPRNP